MALGDGIRRNIAHVDPSERALFRDALVELNRRFFPGNRTDAPAAGHVSWWFKQDEIHQATHVHGQPEFLPWHREIVNRFEGLLRQVNPQLSLHYWDWTQDPRAIPNANLGGGARGGLDLFTSDFMGYGGLADAPIGEPWLSAGYYVPGATPHRDDPATGTPADPPREVRRYVDGTPVASDAAVLSALTYPVMWTTLRPLHDAMHGFVAMGGAHISFRDPFVFLLHSNVDRLFARWQTDPAQSNWERLHPATVYGAESGDPGLNSNVEPWSTGHSINDFGEEHFTRPWYAPENEGVAHNYKHPSIVFPPCYDTNIISAEVVNAGAPPVINFNDVPSGDTAARAASFRVYGACGATIRLRAGGAPAAPFSILLPASGSVTVGHGLAAYQEARIWLAYTAGAANVAVPDGSVTFECVESGQVFTFIIRANSIVRPRVAVMLALDQSNSMSFLAGTSGTKRFQVLQDAARTFMDIIPPGNGVGLIRFDHDAYPVADATFPGLNVTRIGAFGPFDPGRVAGLGAVSSYNFNPLGNTSVGDGLQMARTILNGVPIPDYEHKAIIVFTDGVENQPLSIADVAGDIDSRTFAIGLGNETQVDTAKLNSLANSTGGYLLLTGLLSASIDDYFRTNKYFLQILAGVTNNNVILDPNGYIAPGMIVRIPFLVNDADIDGTAILLTDFPVVEMSLETPGGDLIEPGNAPALGIDFSAGAKTKSYHFALPVAFPGGNHAGTWQVVLEVNKNDFEKYLRKFNDAQDPVARTFRAHGARYSVMATTYSNLKMNAFLHQSSFQPGARMTLRALLAEYGLPVENRASVSVEIKRPDGTQFTLALAEVEPGVFENAFVAVIPGTYVCRFVAQGASMRSVPFTREQTLTGAVFQGGDNPPPKGGGTDGKVAGLIEKCCQRSTWLMLVIALLLLVILIFLIRS